MQGKVLGHMLTTLEPERFIQETERLVNAQTPGFITFCNVHMIMEAEDDPAFAAVLQRSLYNMCDGMPLVKLLQWRGLDAHRTAGPDMFPLLCALAERNGWPIGLYGGSEATLKRLHAYLKDGFPALHISASISPPFRPLTEAETEAHVREINESGARMLFVGLGCPKQEKWMDAHQHALRPLLFGVGGAFSMVTGEVKRAPLWMQRIGLEWLHRFLKEPRRLWKRYVVLNTRFIVRITLEYSHMRKS